MNTQTRLTGWRPLATLLVLALAALACGGEVEPTATPLPRPTQAPASHQHAGRRRAHPPAQRHARRKRP